MLNKYANPILSFSISFLLSTSLCASNVDLATFTSSQGFAIQGAVADDNTGVSVSQAGDINNDGLQDIIVGARLADPNGRNVAGAAYVVYGNDIIENFPI